MRISLSWIGVTLIATFALLQVFFVGLTNDTNMLLHTTAHMLYEGGLYARWITVNSPLVFYIYTLPVLLATTLGLSPAVALHGFTVVLCALSLLIIHRQLRAQNISLNERKLWVDVSAIALFVAPCVFHTFADREHYLFIFSLPWILLMLLRLPPPPVLMALAMIGFCLKPYNILLPLMLILCGGPPAWSLRQRIFSPSSQVAAILGSAYLALVCFVYPDYLRNLQFALTAYAAIAYSFHTRVMEIVPYLALATVLIAGLQPVRRLPFLGFAAAVAAIYALNAGWIYVAYVLAVPAIMICPALLLSDGQSLEWCRKLFVGLIVLSAVSLGAYNLERDMDYTARTGAAQSYNHLHFSADFKNTLIKVAGDNFVLLSTNLWSSQIGVLKGGPHSLSAFDDAPWPLAWVSQHFDDPKAVLIWHAALVQPFFAALREQPVLMVDESPGQFGDLFMWLKKDTAVREALAPYTITQTIDRCVDAKDIECRFTIWRVQGRP